MSELDNAIKRLKENADNKELPYIIADIIKKNCSKDVINLILQHLEFVDNSKPNEVLERLKNLKLCLNTEDEYYDSEDYVIVEQALIKAQENARSDEILQKYYQEGITLDSVRALKQENDKYKQALNIIFENPTQSEATIAYIKTTINPTYEDYCLIVKDEYRLTEDKFNLLKEMLFQ